ncbi:MAG TPA: amino acid adenylation domain-containing protein [Verrucomicrobiae bacterium]|nr:amino acid adenylation domain-containing protein [Verrucomicrobiae bacterium]
MIARLQDWPALHADKAPESTALVMGRERLTYGEVERLSNQLARTLKDGGCRRKDRVGLLAPKSPTAIVAILGILKADCIFVPLDPQSPAARQRKAIESAECRWILANGGVATLLDQILEAGPFSFPLSIGWLGAQKINGASFSAVFSYVDIAAYSAGPLQYENRGTDPAHILFTSGSTGIPKGVVITHANVIHFIEWARSYFNITTQSRNSCHSPLHFDLSTFDIYGALSAGAELHLVPPEANLLPHKLVEFIRRSGLTQWFSVPSILNYLAKFDAVEANDFPELRELLWCGEVFPTPALIYWMQRLPHVRFTNLYGPTEATIASSYYTIPHCPEDERTPIPIGTACPGEELLVLDDRLQRMAVGEVGDLYIRGVGLSPGYWRDPEKTRAAFLPNPYGDDASDRIYKTGDLAWTAEDGLVYYVGRADFQIKSRGYRIELGEIESALNSIAGLRECAVVAVSLGGFEGSRICCAYAPLPGRDVTPIGLRQELARLLPAYMLPAEWLAMDTLPKNANGKIDRPKLVEEFKNHEIPAA